MIDWLVRRIFTVGDVGRWHARSGYPRATDCVLIPLHGLAGPEDADQTDADWLAVGATVPDNVTSLQAPQSPSRRSS